jgi:hypothetical protein
MLKRTLLGETVNASVPNTSEASQSTEPAKMTSLVPNGTPCHQEAASIIIIFKLIN